MKKIDQTKFGMPKGNCFAASLASILEWPLERCDFCPEGVDENDKDILTGRDWSIVFNEWLETNNLLTLWIDATHERVKNLAPNGYSVMSGHNPDGILHSVVAYNGYIVHDPNPSRRGIVDVIDYLVIINMVNNANAVPLCSESFQGNRCVEPRNIKHDHRTANGIVFGYVRDGKPWTAVRI